MENVNVDGTKTNRCPVCIGSPQQLGILHKDPLLHHNYADCEKLYQATEMGRYVYLVGRESCDQNRVNLRAA